MLAKMTLKPEDLNIIEFPNPLEVKDIQTLVTWLETYLGKYPIVGKLKGKEDWFSVQVDEARANLIVNRRKEKEI